MTGLIFTSICILLICGVSGYSKISKGSISNASASGSEAVHTAKELLDIKNELSKIKGPGRKRPRRFIGASINNDAVAAINKAGALAAALLKTYVRQPLTHANFLQSTVRGYGMMDLADGRFVFGTLNGELNQSFRSLWRRHRPRTGDIISCRIPSNRMAEHYMMVVNDRIAEVGVLGGKSTHHGVITIDSYRNSMYINSTECLYHENRIISRAEQIDDQNGDGTQTDRMYQDILYRINCTIAGKNTGQFHYDVLSCNCQDLVLYWAYGYVETKCLNNAFNGCSAYLSHTVFDISHYVGGTGQLQNEADTKRFSLINGIGKP